MSTQPPADPSGHEARRTGVFVTIDGAGGAGKTTVVGGLSTLLTTRGLRVFATREPSDDDIGTLARSRTDRYSGHALACLVAADRYAHLGREIMIGEGVREIGERAADVSLDEPQ